MMPSEKFPGYCRKCIYRDGSLCPTCRKLNGVVPFSFKPKRELQGLTAARLLFDALHGTPPFPAWRKPKMIVILLSGKAGSGKDTFWNITNNHFSPRVKCFRLAFGDAVKKLAMEHAGWNGIKDAPGRKLLQSLGEVGREYNEDSWVNKIIPALKRHAANGTHLVCITDCRYPNEIERIKEIEKELGTVITVRIERPTREDLGANSRHLSETALDSYRFTHTLFNNGTEKEFEEQVHRFLTFLSGKSNNNQKTESECDHF